MRQCKDCQWISDGTPCARCKSKRSRVVPVKEYETLIDRGEIVFCPTCDDYHLGPITRIRQ